MKVFEFSSEISRVEDSSEPWISIETELFLSKSKAIDFMINKALEYEKAYSSAKFYRNVKDYPKDTESIELNSSRDSDVFGLFSVDSKNSLEKEITEFSSPEIERLRDGVAAVS